MNRHEFLTFPSSDLKLAQMTLSQNHETPSDHKQSCCSFLNPSA